MFSCISVHWLCTDGHMVYLPFIKFNTLMLVFELNKSNKSCKVPFNPENSSTLLSLYVATFVLLTLGVSDPIKDENEVVDGELNVWEFELVVLFFRTRIPAIKKSVGDPSVCKGSEDVGVVDTCLGMSLIGTIEAVVCNDMAVVDAYEVAIKFFFMTDKARIELFFGTGMAGIELFFVTAFGGIGLFFRRKRVCNKFVLKHNWHWK